MSRDAQMLLSVVALLVGVGAVMAFSVAGPPKGLVHPAFSRHLLYIALGILCAYLLFRVNPSFLVSNACVILLGICFLCFLVFVPGVGVRIRGAARWLAIGSLHLQPSELAKIGVVLYAARLANDPPQTLRRLSKALLPLALLCILVFAEPDLGTAAFLAFCGGMLVWFAGAKLRQLALLASLAVAIAAPVAVLKFEHVRARLGVFADPESDPLGRGYQLRQSLIAIGSGGVVGKGLGASEQKLFFLPDRNTDFVFAILAEETGFLGAVAVMALFCAYLVLGLRIAMRVERSDLRILAVGSALVIPLQAAINIGVVTGCLPTKGIPLPFLSFGGSSLVVSLLFVGLLARLDMEGARCGLSLREGEVVGT